MSTKPIYVTFADKKLENEFEKLIKGKFEKQQLYIFIQRSMKDIKKNPISGKKIKKSLWPKEYIKKYNITNLWKYNLPDGWRLVYTIQEDKIMILCVVLEWFSHREYERKFGY